MGSDFDDVMPLSVTVISQLHLGRWWSIENDGNKGLGWYTNPDASTAELLTTTTIGWTHAHQNRRSNRWSSSDIEIQGAEPNEEPRAASNRD